MEASPDFVPVRHEPRTTPRGTPMLPVQKMVGRLNGLDLITGRPDLTHPDSELKPNLGLCKTIGSAVAT